MEPRLKSSKKWTQLPKELTDKILDVYAEAFPDQLKKGRFVAEGRIYSEELLFRSGYVEKDRIGQANFELSFDFNSKKQNALDVIYKALDCSAALLSEYFRLGSLDEFPKTWEKQEFEGIQFFWMTSGVNTELEDQANALLGQEAGDLVHGEDEKLETDALKASLGIDPDEA